MTIRIYSFSSARPEFVHYQKATFAHFIQEDHEFIVVNDGRLLREGRSLKRAAQRASARHIRVPLRIRRRSLRFRVPLLRDPSVGLGEAMTFAVQSISQDDDLILLVHGDIFACAPVSLRSMFSPGVGLLAMPSEKESNDRVIFHPWSGVIMLRPSELPDIQQIRFNAGLFEGVRCDTGGQLIEYVRDYPTVQMRSINKTDWIFDPGPNPVLTPLMDVPGVYGPLQVDRVAGSFLHYGSGSNWDGREAEFHRIKTDRVFSLLDSLLRGDYSLPEEDYELVQDWPAPKQRSS